MKGVVAYIEGCDNDETKLVFHDVDSADSISP
ncbi:MAG: hypothetical protein JWM78_1215 [Verrucomicrobiaceae bacterium]|nr:hypothetical protein [Verrucomicrobiaceae bacterium]